MNLNSGPVQLQHDQSVNISLSVYCNVMRGSIVRKVFFADRTTEFDSRQAHPDGANTASSYLDIGYKATGA
jgi:hypothetical protein